jgi:hypothetical protein
VEKYNNNKLDTYISLYYNPQSARAIHRLFRTLDSSPPSRACSEPATTPLHVRISYMFCVRFSDACGACARRLSALQDLGPLPFLAGSFGPPLDPLTCKYVYRCCTCFADTCCPAHSPRALSIRALGPWTPPPPRRLARTPGRPLSM